VPCLISWAGLLDAESYIGAAIIIIMWDGMLSESNQSWAPGAGASLASWDKGDSRSFFRVDIR